MPVSYFRLLELLSLTCFKFGEKLPHNPVEKVILLAICLS